MSETFRISDGDLWVDPVTGRLALIDGIEKCSQDIAEAIMVDSQQSNRSGVAFSRPLGSELARVGTERPLLFGGVIGKPMVAKKVQEALVRLQTMQGRDPNITPEERIASISRLVVEALNVTDYIFFVECMVESGDRAIAHNLRPTSLNHQFPMTGGVAKTPG